MAEADVKSALHEVLVSAPGKLILHGEHAVVHGSTALAASLNLRSFLQLKPAESTVSLTFPDLDVHRTWELSDIFEIVNGDNAFIEHGNGIPSLSSHGYDKVKEIIGVESGFSTHDLALVTFMCLYLCIWKLSPLKDLPPLHASITTTLPTGAGLGSSAAYSVCLSAGLLTYFKVLRSLPNGTWTEEDKDVINKWAYEGERIIHGNPSGIDNAVSVLGGTLRYKSKVIEPLKNLPSVKILVMNTKVPRSTKALVAGVKVKYEKYPDIIGPVFQSVNNISINCESLLSSLGQLSPSDKVKMTQIYASLEELVDINQYFLQIIGVSHPSINQICDITSKAGIKSKLTGAGGGGCVFAILRPDQDKDVLNNLQSQLVDAGFESWITTMGGIGVMQHKSKEDLLKSGFLLPKNL